MKNTTKTAMNLIIDDSMLIGEKLQRFLFNTTAALPFEHAKNVNEGMVLFTALNPEIVFLDIKLPDGNGIDVLVSLKKMNPGVKVIIFSNLADNFYQKKFREKGCDYFLDKSKDFVKIPGVINEIIALTKTN